MSKQLRLPLLADDQTESPNGTSYFNDPAFANNKSLPIHRWVPWIAGFSSDFVKDVLRRYTNGASTILDPFTGVGTTLVEAVMFGHNVVGFEINPYAALASRVKVNSYTVDTPILDKYKLEFKQFYDEKLQSDYVPKSSPPKGFKTRSAFYSLKVLHKVLIFQDFVNLIEDRKISDLFKVAFTPLLK